MKLGELGEERLLARLLPSLSIHDGGVLAAAGDDCAVVAAPSGGNLLLLKTDCVVGKVHFKPTADPVQVGWKAMMRPVSDFAAMSGVPQFALITLVVPSRTTKEWVEKIYRGLNRAAAKFDISVVGGETSSTGGPAVISVSVTGFVEKNRWVSRRGGKAGDDLFVTGRLGGAGEGKHLRFVPRVEESRWLTKQFSIHAMIDLSDGLGADLPRLAQASKVGFQIEQDKLPRNPGANIKNAISDGEDYELLFAISPRYSKRLQSSWRKKFPKLPLTPIGRFTQPSTINHQPFRGGYVHFQ